TQNLENDVKIDKYDLIKKAKKFYELHDLSILKQYIGDRTSTNDYFPILGEVIDANSTIEAYPYITKGSKVPTCKYVKHENLYLHIALSSRGFVTAPYNAKLLSDLILDKKEIDERLSPTRLFRKWARRGDR
ncbi:MAG: hypothetical protein GXO30_08000, partial [Epsilonproteobacteria bacterium]|nr:hypothetical protein [Campylobacterota bacterium]